MSPNLIPSDQIQAEAASWLVKLQSETRSEDEERAFRAWLSTDPMHGAAFEAVNTAWDIAGGLPRDLRGQSHDSRSTNRRTVMAVTATVLAAGGSFMLWRSAQAQTFETDVGEQKHVSLDDGTRIFLDTNTRLKVRFSGTQRSTDLEYGQVNLRVAADSSRPFIVNAASTKVVANPSNLDIRLDRDQLSVVLIRGTADVLRSSVQPELLEAGDRLIIDAHGLGHRDRPALASLVAWQTGQAIFENGRLADAAAEMNRYSNIKLFIEDPEVGQLRLSGIYTVGDNIGFANSIAGLLHVRLIQGEGRIEIIPDKTEQTRG